MPDSPSLKESLNPPILPSQTDRAQLRKDWLLGAILPEAPFPCPEAQLGLCAEDACWGTQEIGHWCRY